MARWKLTASHYINVEGTTWEYTEIDRKTGRPKRTKFLVPRLLNVNDPLDWTEVYTKDEDGAIIVSDGVNPGKNDIIYHGDPTPDMLPLDDDAKAKSALHNKKWNLPQVEGGYTEELLQQLTEKLNDAKSQALNPMQGITEILAAMQKMMEQNQALIQTLSETKGLRRA